MPEMNGIEVVEKIREKYGQESMVVIASAYDYSEIADTAEKLGINRFISKPIFPSTVYNLLLSLTKKHSKQILQAKKTYDFSGKRILVAEDNEINQIVAIEFLKKANIVCEIANNGKEAVEKFLNAEPHYYDAILMDMDMPVMDGCEATIEIRKSNSAEAKDIAIIAMTANAFTNDVAKCLQSGMNDHIGKPIILKTMFEILDKAFKKEENNG